MMRVGRYYVVPSTAMLYVGVTAKAVNVAYANCYQVRGLSGLPPPPPPPLHGNNPSTTTAPAHPPMPPSPTSMTPLPTTNLLSRRPFTDGTVTQRLEASAKFNNFKSTMWVGIRELTELLEDVQNICADADDSPTTNTPNKNHNYQQAALCKSISGTSTHLVDPSHLRMLASYLLTHGLPDVSPTVAGNGGGLEFLDQLEAMGTRYNTDASSSDAGGDLHGGIITPLAIIESARSVLTAPPPPPSFPSAPATKSQHKKTTSTYNNDTHHQNRQQQQLYGAGGTGESSESSDTPTVGIQCLSSMGNPFNPTSPFHIELRRNIEERQLPCMGMYLQMQGGNTTNTSTSSNPASAVDCEVEMEMDRHYWFSANDAQTFGTTIVQGASGVRKYTNNFNGSSSDSGAQNSGYEYFHFTDLADPTVCGIQTCISLEEARQVCVAPEVSSEVVEDRRLQLLTYLRSTSAPAALGDTVICLAPPTSKKNRRVDQEDIVGAASSFRPQPVGCREAPILRPLNYHNRIRLQGHYVRVLRHRQPSVPLSPLWGTHEALESAASFIVSAHTQLFGDYAPTTTADITTTPHHHKPVASSPRIQPGEVPVALFQGQRLVLLYNACQLEGATEFHTMLDRVSNSTGTLTTPPPAAAHHHQQSTVAQ